MSAVDEDKRVDLEPRDELAIPIEKRASAGAVETIDRHLLTAPSEPPREVDLGEVVR